MQKAGWVLRTFKTRELSLIQPHQDYASKLWAPVGILGDLAAQEAPLKSFTKRTRGFWDLSYWERLVKAGMMSNECRQERYRIIYSWKIIQGLAPNCGLTLDSSMDSRRGRTLSIPPLSGSRTSVQTLRDRTFQSEGPRLYNSLPSELRNLDSSLPIFKAHLDCYLSSIPDQPTNPG